MIKACELRQPGHAACLGLEDSGVAAGVLSGFSGRPDIDARNGVSDGPFMW